MRRAIKIKIKEEIEVIEGEVQRIVIDSDGKKESGKLVVRTMDMESVYDLGPKMIESIKLERIQSGDIIQIDKSSGKIVKLGKSFSKMSEFDAQGSRVKFIKVPEGEL